MTERLAVLVVEDQDFMRRALRDYLQFAYPDAAVIEAADGARALELCRSRSPQLNGFRVALREGPAHS